MAEVIVGERESLESALKRFTKRVQQYGILSEARRRRHYEKPSVKRKRRPPRNGASRMKNQPTGQRSA